MSENAVAGLMSEQELGRPAQGKHRSSTGPGKGRWRAEDVVRRKFGSDVINRRWYGDGMEIKAAEANGWANYLRHAVAQHAFDSWTAAPGGG